MTIDVVRVRTDRPSRPERDEGVPLNRDAMIDVSDLPAEQVETYVERAIGNGYDVYLERRGAKAFLTAVREPRNGDVTARNAPTVPNHTDRLTDQPTSEWNYAVFATESTLQ